MPVTSDCNCECVHFIFVILASIENNTSNQIERLTIVTAESPVVLFPLSLWLPVSVCLSHTRKEVIATVSHLCLCSSSQIKRAMSRFVDHKLKENEKNEIPLTFCRVADHRL
jgi:hypothetical protein